MRILINTLFVFFLTSQVVLAATLTPGAYQLLDHPDGSVVSSQGPYGLRLDALSPPTGVGPTFSVETNNAYVTLLWDGGNTATISGSIWNNTTNEMWTVNHDLTDIVIVPGPDGGFSALNGVMTLIDPLNNILTINSDQDNAGIAFNALGNSHRCAGHSDCGPFIGEGWLEPGTPDGQFNDWLVQLNPIPVPAAVWLFGSALIGLVGVAKGRRNI